MNIGVDIRCLMSPVRTGVGEYTYQLLNAVFAFDKTNQYFLFYNSSKDVSQSIPKWEQENVHYVGLKWPNKLLNLLLFLKFVKLENLVVEKLFENCKLKIENLNVWFSPNLNFTSLRKHTKHILTIHDLSFEFMPECLTWKQRLWHWFLRPKKQCERADIILTPSENTKRDVIDSYLPAVQAQALQAGKVVSSKVVSSKVVKVGHGCGMQNAECRMQNGDKYILYVGTLEPRKNVDALIEAYKKLCTLAHLHTCKLIIAGDRGWKSEPVIRLIENTPGVQYIGYVDEAKKVELYRNASLFVFPSLYEGFGLPVLEAMSAGVPVITSNRSSLPEVCGDAVYYVNPNNVLELAEAMKLVLTDEKLRQNMIQKGLEQAKKFSWEDSAKVLLSLF